MKTLRYSSLMIVTAGLFMATAHSAAAQVSVSIGEPPVCPYGYYEVPPYNCAPDGYYGPEWFSGGIFVGAGPWFHGPEHFYGSPSIIISISARDTVVRCPRAASVRRTTGQSFTARQCMTLVAMRLLADTGKGRRQSSTFQNVVRLIELALVSPSALDSGFGVSTPSNDSFLRAGGELTRH